MKFQSTPVIGTRLIYFTPGAGTPTMLLYERGDLRATQIRFPGECVMRKAAGRGLYGEIND